MDDVTGLIARLFTEPPSYYLSWPATATGYQLECTPSAAAGAVWANVTTPPVVVATEQIVTVDIGAGAQFFRLRKL